MPRKKLNTSFAKHATANASEFNHTNAVVNDITDLIDSGRLSGTTVSVSTDPQGYTVLTFHGVS